MTTDKRLTKAQQREATITKLIEVAREIFAEKGYAHTATEDIVQRANVTRGALYHHFKDKEDLFKAVAESVQKEVAARIEQAAGQVAEPWEQLLAGNRAFLEACLDPTIQRIMLMDAPAVLGWETWRQLDAENSMRLLAVWLKYLVKNQVMKPVSTEALAHLLSGAMNEAALWIARSDDPHHALEEAVITLETLLASLRLS